MVVFEYAKNLETGLIIKVDKSINSIEKYVNKFIKLIRKEDREDAYMLVFTDKPNSRINIVCHKDSDQPIEISKYESQALKILTKNDSNYNIKKIIEIINSHSQLPKDINMIKSSLLMMDNNDYYNQYFHELLSNQLHGGGLGDYSLTKNFKITSIILLLLSLNPLPSYGYKIMRLILTIYNYDIIGIITNLVDFIPGIFGTIAGYGNLLRLIYLIYKDNKKENEEEEEEE